MGAIVVGPRIGRFVNGTPQLMSGHTVPVSIVFLVNRDSQLELTCIPEVTKLVGH